MNTLTNIWEHTTWERIAAISGGLTALSAILEKVFKFEFLWNWIKKIGKGIKIFFQTPMLILEDIKHIKLQQLINQQTLSAIENEVKYNGGKYTLKTVVKEIRELVDKLIENGELSNAKLKATLAVANDPIFIMDAKGNMTFINSALCRTVECSSPEHLLGRGWESMIPPEEREERIRVAERYFQHPYPYSGPVVYRNLRTNEKINVYVRTTMVINNKTDEIIEIIGVWEILK